MKILSITKTLLVAGLLAAPLCHSATEDEGASRYSPLHSTSPALVATVTTETEQDCSKQAATFSSLSDDAGQGKKKKSRTSKKEKDASKKYQATSSAPVEDGTSSDSPYGYSAYEATSSALVEDGSSSYSPYGYSAYEATSSALVEDGSSSYSAYGENFSAPEGQKVPAGKKSKKTPSAYLCDDDSRAAPASAYLDASEVVQEESLEPKHPVRQPSHDIVSQASGTSSSTRSQNTEVSKEKEQEKPKTVTLPQVAVVNAAEDVHMTIGQQGGKLVFGLQPPIEGLVPNTITGAIEAALHADFYQGNQIRLHVLSSREIVDIGFNSWTKPQDFNVETMVSDKPVTGLFRLFFLSEDGNENILAQTKRTFELGAKDIALQIFLTRQDDQTRIRLDWAEPSAEDDDAEEEANGEAEFGDDDL